MRKINKIIELLKKIVKNYELRHPQYEEPVYICTNFDTRNRFKNEKYKIPENEPQCPVYKDNRCCGGCKLAAKCEHCVNCNCFGFTYGQMGGNDKDYYLHKASKYYGLGRLDKNGKFDWEYYYIQNKRKEIQVGKFVVVDNKLYEIKSKPNRCGKFKAIEVSSGCWKRLNIYEMENYIKIYRTKETAYLFNEECK